MEAWIRSHCNREGRAWSMCGYRIFGHPGRSRLWGRTATLQWCNQKRKLGAVEIVQGSGIMRYIISYQNFGNTA